MPIAMSNAMSNASRAMRWLALGAAGAGAALFLTSCTAGKQGDGTVFRALDVPIFSTTRFEAAQFAGFWHLRAAFGPGAAFGPSDEPALYRGVTFHTGPSGKIARITLHGVQGSGAFGAEKVLEVEQPMAGRLVVGRAPNATEYWVLWLDADYRTAAIGTPSGKFGWIIDRKRSGGSDRIRAASEILDWVGYDMSKLVILP